MTQDTDNRLADQADQASEPAPVKRRRTAAAKLRVRRTKAEKDAAAVNPEAAAPSAEAAATAADEAPALKKRIIRRSRKAAEDVQETASELRLEPVSDAAAGDAAEKASAQPRSEAAKPARRNAKPRKMFNRPEAASAPELTQVPADVSDASDSSEAKPKAAAKRPGRVHAAKGPPSGP